MVYNDTDHRGGTRVQVYNTTGEGERLPDMKTGRMWHAWEEVGQLRQNRTYHATSVINITQIDTYLNCD